MSEFEQWLRTVCFQKPTPEAYDLAKCAWAEALNTRNEWLSVESGLPSDDKCFDVYIDYFDCEGRVADCFYNGEYWWKWDDDWEKGRHRKIKIEGVTHYRSVPPSPKGE